MLLPHELYWHQGHNIAFAQLNVDIMLQIILQYWPADKQSWDLDDRRNGFICEPGDRESEEDQCGAQDESPGAGRAPRSSNVK